MASKTPQSVHGVPCCGVASGFKVDLDRAGVVQEPDDVRAAR